MVITKEIGIDMGHRVPNHKSKCFNVHGHRYKFEVGVDGELISEAGNSSEGMVIDFGDLKKVMTDNIDAKLDHGFMLYKGDKLIGDSMRALRDGEAAMKVIEVDFIPTAENITKYVFDMLEGPLREFNIQLEFVKVWETPTSAAIYERKH